MLRYHLQTEIHKPLDTVTRLFTNREVRSQWQPGLISSEQVETYPHPKYTLKYAFGRRKIIMTEMILRNELPTRYEESYEMKGVINRISNTFESKDAATTLWTYTSEFHFSGLMKIISLFMKDGFRQQSVVIMRNFKKYAESK